MSYCYFDINKSGVIYRDDFGDDFGDDFSTPEAARHQAQVLLYDVMREDPPAGGPHTVAYDVRDETGRIVYRGELTFQETWGLA